MASHKPEQVVSSRLQPSVMPPALISGAPYLVLHRVIPYSVPRTGLVYVAARSRDVRVC